MVFLKIFFSFSFFSLEFANFLLGYAVGSKWMAYISGFPQQLHDFFSRASTRDPEMRRLICFLGYYTSSTSFRQNAYVSFREGIAYATSFLHILSKKGMKGVKPSASSGSHNSFIKPLASSLVVSHPSWSTA